MSRFKRYLIYVAGMICLLPRAGMAQELAGTEPTASETGPGPSELHHYLKDTFGPLAFARAGLSAAIDQGRDYPSKWGQNGSAYGQRFGSSFGQLAIENTTVYGLNRLLRLDGSYHRCDCLGFFPRLRHAVISTVTARRADGSSVLSVPSIVAPYTAAVVASAWQPVSTGSYTLSAGTSSLATGAALNVVREFLPHRSKRAARNTR